MNIVFLNIYNGRVQRGAEVFVDQLASALSERHAVTVVQTGKRKTAPYKTMRIAGIPLMPHQGHQRSLVRVLAPWLYPLLVAWFTVKALPTLWRGHYDWIIPVNGGWQVLLCRLFRAVRGGNLLVSGHAGIGRDDWWNLRVGRPDVFVALTLPAYRWAQKTGGAGHVAYIPNGVDDQLFSEKGPVAQVDLTPPIVLCVAALVTYKRVDLLIRALATVPAASLLLIGDGPLRGPLRELGNTLLGKRFLHLQTVAHEDMSSYYRAARVFSLPSQRQEAFGLVYLEALSCNVPVVAPNDESRKQLIGDGGIVCQVEQETAYAQALVQALENDFANRPRLQAQHYTWKAVAKQYETVMS